MNRKYDKGDIAIALYLTGLTLISTAIAISGHLNGAIAIIGIGLLALSIVFAITNFTK